MKRILLFISLALASLQAYAQPVIADTTRVKLFDRGNQWSTTMLDVKTYIGASSGSVATDAIWDAAGDIVQGTGANTAAKLPIGTASQQLRVNAGATALEYFTPSAGSGANLTFSGASTPYTLNSDTGTDVTFAAGSGVTLSRTANELTIAASSGSVATDAIWDAKGDLAVGTGADTGAKLTVGTDGGQIYADASTSTGLRWLPSVISPAQITSDQDDYAPTGWAKCQVLRVSGDVSLRAITSLAATFAGDIKTISNVGSYPVYFPSEHPDGTAANRISGSKDNFLPPGKSAQIQYDGTLSRWLWLTDLPDWEGGTHFLQVFRPGSIAAGDRGEVVFTTSGGSTVAGSSNTFSPAGTEITTSTSATGATSLGMGKGATAFFFMGAAHIFSEATVFFTTLSDGTQTYEFNTGAFTSNTSTTLNVNNSFGIRYTHGTNSGKFQGFWRDNTGTETTVDLGVTVAVNTRYVLRAEMNYAQTEIRFYVNGVYSGRVTGFAATSTSVAGRTIIVKSAGTTLRKVTVVRQIFGAIF